MAMELSSTFYRTNRENTVAKSYFQLVVVLSRPLKPASALAESAALGPNDRRTLTLGTDK
jgi:hypothetical protein